MCDNIRSSENIGSIFRTSDAIAADKVFLCGISGTPAFTAGRPPSEKIAKTALGAEKNVPWEYYSQTWRLIEKLKKEGVFIVCLEQTGESLSYEKFSPRSPLALVLGNEVKGVSGSVLERADAVVHVPMYGQKESLNVAVAVGIALYHVRCRN